MSAFDREQLEAIVDAVCENLDGEWLVIGGAIASLWFDPRRTTEDLDIIGIRQDPRDRSALFDLGTKLGIPLEAMSSAADYFVFRIPDWRDHLVRFRSGTRGVVYRPSATLFLLLKLGRLDERDLEDCRALVGSGEAFDHQRVLAAVVALPPAADRLIAERRAALVELLARETSTGSGT